ncbi:hypothetical protein CVT24_005543 [Panaeolus cyanescens]|uniref:Uncharacterized protein n=1 Tax=Panaeolus cyanescens TaxID=181874 RepID=A0A409VQH2_9AGAR|nr:hypothetical protein CVT24_005543 [Panaeolus cyanescens]
MKLPLHHLFLASTHLALFAGIGKAHFVADPSELSARQLGHEILDHHGTRDYQSDSGYHHTRRQLPQPNLSSFSTRELADELQSRLERRSEADKLLPGIQKLADEFKQLSKIKAGKRTPAQRKRYTYLKTAIRDQRSKYWELKNAEETSGAASNGHKTSNAGHGSSSDSESASGSSSSSPEP